MPVGFAFPGDRVLIRRDDDCLATEPLKRRDLLEDRVGLEPLEPAGPFPDIVWQPAAGEGLRTVNRLHMPDTDIVSELARNPHVGGVDGAICPAMCGFPQISDFPPGSVT